MPGESDAELMRRYALGDSCAFEELFRRYERRAYAYFLRRTRCEERARDLYQDLFLKIHRFRDSFDPTFEFEPWFFRIASRVLADDFRRTLRAPAGVELEPAERAYDPDPERQSIATEEVALLLRGLSQQQRSVLVASKMIGLQYAEIADILGSSVDSVRQAGSRTLRKLRAGPRA